MTPGTLQRKSTSALAERVLMQASNIARLHAKLRHVIAFFRSRVQDTEFYAILNFGVWQIVAVKMQRLLKLFFHIQDHGDLLTAYEIDRILNTIALVDRKSTRLNSSH